MLVKAIRRSRAVLTHTLTCVGFFLSSGESDHFKIMTHIKEKCSDKLELNIFLLLFLGLLPFILHLIHHLCDDGYYYFTCNYYIADNTNSTCCCSEVLILKTYIRSSLFLHHCRPSVAYLHYLFMLRGCFPEFILFVFLSY